MISITLWYHRILECDGIICEKKVDYKLYIVRQRLQVIAKVETNSYKRAL